MPDPGVGRFSHARDRRERTTAHGGTRGPVIEGRDVRSSCWCCGSRRRMLCSMGSVTDPSCARSPVTRAVFALVTTNLRSRGRRGWCPAGTRPRLFLGGCRVVGADRGRARAVRGNDRRGVGPLRTCSRSGVRMSSTWTPTRTRSTRSASHQSLRVPLEIRSRSWSLRNGSDDAGANTARPGR